MNYSQKPVTNYKLKTELKVPHRYQEQPEAGSIPQQALSRRLVRLVRLPKLRLKQADQDEQGGRQAPLELLQQV